MTTRTLLATIPARPPWGWYPRGWVAALALVACGGPSDADPPTPTDPGDDDDDGPIFDNTGLDSAPPYESPWFEPIYLLVEAGFGFDTLTGVVDVGTPYGDVTSGITLTLGSAEWYDVSFDPAATEYYCQILLPVQMGPLPTWAISEDLWFGVDYDPIEPAQTNCGTPGYEMDPSVWGYGPDYGFAGVAWGMGVGALPSNYAMDYATSDYIDNFIGGYIENEILPAPRGQEGYLAWGVEMDAGNQVVVNTDGTFNYLLSDDIPLAGLPAPRQGGAYSIVPLYIWQI